MYKENKENRTTSLLKKIPKLKCNYRFKIILLHD